MRRRRLSPIYQRLLERVPESYCAGELCDFAGSPNYEASNVRLWHLSDIGADAEHVRFWG